ncbi:MAG TPA: PAS domain S-box protein [Acetobacteraceae bacterium]|nr:PAS domain S-box protein [Acetobacteraceae bacterium]
MNWVSQVRDRHAAPVADSAFAEAATFGGDELLALAEAAAGIGIWDVELGPGLLRARPQFFRMLGLEPTDQPIPIETIRRIRHPHDRDRVMQTLHEAAASGRDLYEIEYRIIRPDGQLRWIFGRGRLIRDANGTVVRNSGVDVDITARKLAEAALRESEERFRRVFEQSPLGKAMAGLDLRFRSVNPALCTMLGYSEEELVGRSLLDVVHPDDRETHGRLGQSLINGSLPQIQVEQRLLRRSGDPLWVSVNVAPIRDAEGNSLYTLGVFENIDERRRMTEALRESETHLRLLNEQLARQATERDAQLASSQAQLQAFFVNSADWLTLQRVSPDGRSVYADINPACEAAYGLRREQVIGRTAAEVLGAEAAELPMRLLRECLRTGRSQRYVARRTNNGRTTTVDVMFVLVPQMRDGDDRFVITSARDVTEREQLEAQLRQAQKMEAIGQLTGGVAHDFNNLLAVIGGNAELARRRPSSMAKQMENILRATERGVTLTRQLLSFSRRHVGTPQLIDLRIEMPRIAEMLPASLRGNIQMRLSVAPDVWPIEVDMAELEMALLNVAVNARDAMPYGGTFELDIRNGVPAEGVLNRHHVAITLRDTGIGIPADVVGKVFDPFFTTKQPGEGTGLGLSQVYGFVQQSGGLVNLDSTPGDGTTITIRLPRSTNQLPAAQSQASAGSSVALSGNILLVEDNPLVADVTAQMLITMGFHVEVVDRARKALDRLGSGAAGIDLLLTDVVMPDALNGVDLAVLVRDRFPALPVILTSGYNDAVTPTSGAFPILRKPVPYDELSRAICTALERDDRRRNRRRSESRERTIG